MQRARRSNQQWVSRAVLCAVIAAFTPDALAQPANNNCANAIAIGNGTVSFSNINATTDGPSPCAPLGSDIWYCYTASCTGTASVSTCGSLFDTVVAVYAGGTTCTCPAGTSIACNDDSCDLQSDVSFPVTSGQRYLIQLGGYSGDQGTGSLTVSCSTGGGGPANDFCANAQLVTVGSVTGSTASATNDGSNNCGLSSSSADVWYRFVPTQDGQLIADTCVAASFDTVLSIHTSCPGTGANQLSCNDDSCGLQSRVTANVTSGSTYYIRVAGYSGARGTFTLTVALGPPPPPCTTGPDVTVFDLIDINNDGASGGITAYSVGTNACNLGCDPVEWIAGSNQHPVIGQNMYRLMNGRFEQIGQSWLKHAFASTNSPGCGTCQDPPNGGAQLGVGCADAYGSGLNGSQGGLGPRSQVNATTGAFPYPPTAPGFSTVVDRRLQVFTTDVTPAQNPGALYYAECHYVTADDALANNGLNNASFRQISIGSATSSPVFAGATQPHDPAIRAWRDADPAVTLVPADYVDGGITARFWVAARATSNGNGTWHYEYAIHNLNSDRSGGTFSVPIPAGVAVSNMGFHAPFSHSGEPYSNAPWTLSASGGSATFATQTFAANSNANALRWGTLYNFRFDANVAPATGSATLGLFKPGSPASLTITGLPVPGTTCPPSPNGDMNADSAVDGVDIAGFVGAVLSGSTNPSDVCRGDFNNNGAVDAPDVPPFVSVLLTAS